MSDQHVIAIDGPSASGKSTTAREVAATLGMVHLNSGMLYRAITWIALRDGWAADCDFESGMSRLKLSLVAVAPEFELRVNGLLPGPSLQSSGVNARVSAVAARAEVRQLVTNTLHGAAKNMSVVMDGRDIGTVVFPAATLKIFLTASADVRAQRRLSERSAGAGDSSLPDEIALLVERDRLDATRRIAPLCRAPDAVEVETSNLTRLEAVERIVGLYRERVLEAG